MFTLILNSDYRINLIFFIPCLHKHPISLNPLTPRVTKTEFLLDPTLNSPN